MYCMQDVQPVLSTARSRPEIIRSPILSLPPYKRDDLFKSTADFYERGTFVKSASVRRMPLFVNVQGVCLVTFRLFNRC